VIGAALTADARTRDGAMCMVASGPVDDVGSPSRDDLRDTLGGASTW
jgi:hypothetical protein